MKIYHPGVHPGGRSGWKEDVYMEIVTSSVVELILCGAPELMVGADRLRRVSAAVAVAECSMVVVIQTALQTGRTHRMDCLLLGLGKVSTRR